MKRAYSRETILVHGGYSPAEHNRSRMVPLYQTSAFCYDSVDHAASLFAMDEPGFIYQRLGNPTVDVVEKRLAELEGGRGAVGFASGMAAVSGMILNMLKPGDEIVASRCLYGGTMGLLGDTLKTLGITTRFFDPLKPETLVGQVNENSRLLIVENLANPALTVPDYGPIVDVCRKHSLPLVVDNTIATPFLTNPLEYGADLVVHSCTKYLDGHGSIIGGVVIDSGRFAWDRQRYPLLFEEAPGGKSFVEKYGPDAFLTRLRGKVLMNTGGCMAPFHAYLLLHGMESLHVRMERHCRNALELAQALVNNPKVAWVNYPGLNNHPSYQTASKYLRGGFGGMMGLGLKGGYEACRNFINRVKLLSHCTNIGDAKTLVIHPASTTHRNVSPADRVAAGITDDFIRISVGLENAKDLLAEIEEAMA